ncbi:MAG: hypothetical protein H4O13_05120 [Xanthomonadales bacterium]|nr:hypothetical protein [Xanthomonadales bacterium]
MSRPSPRSSSIPPFWLNLRSISTYPFRGDALFTLLLLSAAELLTGLPVLGFFINLFLLLWAYKYAFSVLRDTAHGRMESQVGVLESPDSVVFKFVALNILMLLMLLPLAYAFGAVGAGLGLIVITFAQPAATMALAMDESLANALNPSTWFALIGRIGLPYGLLWLLLLVFQASAANAADWLDAWLPGIVATVLAQALFLWGLFGTFHLMGYLIYQYHERLGFEPDGHVHAAEVPRNRESELVAAASARVREGDSAGALAVLREEMRERALSLEAHELYRRLLRAEGDAAELARHARQYLYLLMVEKQDRKALALARECLDADSAFAPMEGADGLRLAERAEQLSQHKLAADILIGTARSHAREAVGTEAALRAARALRERYGRDDLAQQLLTFVHGQTKNEERRAQLAAALG